MAKPSRFLYAEFPVGDSPTAAVRRRSFALRDLSSKLLQNLSGSPEDSSGSEPVLRRDGKDLTRRAGDSGFPPLDGDEAVSHAIAPSDPFGAVYDLMFEMAEMLVSRTGSLRQELVGFEFDGDVPVPARAVRVGQSDALHRLMDEMLARWPVVAHIFQGWSLPESNSAGYRHVRSEVIVIALHTHDRACIARCKVVRPPPARGTAKGDSPQPGSVTVEKGELRAVERTPDAHR
jgi:hypothetical protein